MNVIFKLNNLYNKNDDQLNKEMKRRGLRPNDGKTKVDKICEIIAYDAYNAGRSDYKQKVKKTEKSTNSIHSIKINGVTSEIALNNQPERSTIILTYEGENTAYLKVTEDQKRLIKWLIGNDWMCDTTIREISGIQWVEP